MEISNKDEYRIIRDEMQRLLNCITTYLGYVLGGFGASVVTIFAVIGSASKISIVAGDSQTAVAETAALVAMVLLLLAIAMSMVLQIIFYKFNSHNRYAGYCKLLNQEQLILSTPINPAPGAGAIDVMSWETCVDRLRDSDFDSVTHPNPIPPIVPGLVGAHVINAGDSSEITSRVGPDKSVDKHKYVNGFWLICQSLIGRVTTRTWQFPLYVVGVFLAITLIYIGLSIYAIHTRIPELIRGISDGSSYYGLIYAVLVAILAVMWLAFFGQLHTLMKGSATVDSYCWRFLPLRFEFIRKKHPTIEYRLIRL